MVAFTPLALLEQTPVKGNAYSDRHLFQAAHRIIADSAASFEHKIAALRKMDEAMGEVGEYTQQAIDEYLAQAGD